MDKGNMKKVENHQYKKGLWSAEEDRILLQYVREHGRGRWNRIAKMTGLKRCGKSCRLRWLNYLCPNVKKGDFSKEEDDLIIRLHKLLGNRWSLIAGRVPGRTDNQVKNHWNTHLRKKLGIEKQNGKSLANSMSKLMGKIQDEKVVNTVGLQNNDKDSQLSCNGTEDTTMNHSTFVACRFIDEEAEWNEWMSRDNVESLMLLNKDLNHSREEELLELSEYYTLDQLWQHI